MQEGCKDRQCLTSWLQPLPLDCVDCVEILSVQKERAHLWSPLTLHNKGLSSSLRCVPTDACVQLKSSYDFITLLMQPIRPL